MRKGDLNIEQKKFSIISEVKIKNYIKLYFYINFI